MKKKENFIFQNKVSRFAAARARVGSMACRILFGIQREAFDLVAIPKGEVYKNFNVLTLVRRSEAESMLDEKGKPFKAQEIDPKNSLVIGTIRMGFGHWRIAIALASAANSMGVRAYLLDLMSFSETPIEKSIKFLEGAYNSLSRLSQKSKLFNTLIWEPITSGMNARLDSAIQNREVSKLFTAALEKLPKEIPVVAAHPWVGWSAVLCGMKKVVSMIPDNLPLAFWLVEGSIHTVQSPSAYMGYRTLIHMEKGAPILNCIPQDEIVQTGHYVDYEILDSIKSDCEMRLEREKNHEARRLLLTMGGAGAQASKFGEIANYCKTYIEQKKVCLLINMGDHEGRWNELKLALEKNSIPYQMHTDWKKTQAFAESAKKTKLTGVHIFLHSDFYAAVYCTNLLMHISDVMITKPSELSFYPIPKLFIQRVGRHEAWGAIRSSEIGGGTKEATNPQILNRILKMLVEEDDLLKLYIKSILDNNKIKIYDGAINVVKIAMKKTNETKPPQEKKKSTKK